MVLTSILGGAGFGLLVRFWQMGIMKKDIFHNLPAHAAYMVGFGVVGYWADVWEIRSNELIAMRREAIRRNRLEQSERAAAQALAE
ncbi:hypothetical protein BU17DRAFT_40699 [Hysterangium stoloniferum]|nr:hypothetical protein BU17DRAFT_40699 [Hysterangium stoloniferum]